VPLCVGPPRRCKPTGLVGPPLGTFLGRKNPVLSVGTHPKGFSWESPTVFPGGVFFCAPEPPREKRPQMCDPRGLESNQVCGTNFEEGHTYTCKNGAGKGPHFGWRPQAGNRGPTRNILGWKVENKLSVPGSNPITPKMGPE